MAWLVFALVCKCGGGGRGGEMGSCLVWHSIVQLAPGALFPSCMIWSGFSPKEFIHDAWIITGLHVMYALFCDGSHLSFFPFFFHYFLFSSLPVSEGAATPRILKEAKTRKRKKKKEREAASHLVPSIHPSRSPIPTQYLASGKVNLVRLHG